MAGPYYVRSTTGNDGNAGTSWAQAKATLAGALALAVAGDSIYVSQVHAETQASLMTLTCGGSAAAPLRVLCGDDSSEPPVALATTGTITTTGANGINLTGFAYFYGLTFNVGSGAVTSTFNIAGAATTQGFWFESCTLALVSSGTASRLTLCSGTNNVADIVLEFVNCLVTFGSVSQTTHWRARTNVRGGSWAATGAAPTALFTSIAGCSEPITCTGVDLSALGSGKSLVSVTAGAQGTASFQQCKLGAGVAVTTGTPPGPGGVVVLVDNCASDDTNYRMQRVQYYGTAVSDTTVFRVGGASNGATPLSHKLTTGSQVFWAAPLLTPDLTMWNSTTGSSKTVGIQIVHDSVTALTTTEVWIRAEYLGTTGFPQSVFVADSSSSIIATGTQQTTSSAAWTTTGLSNPNTQALEIGLVPREIGLIRVNVALAKPNYSIWVDPLIVVT